MTRTLYVSDLDGTLLGSDATVSDNTRSILNSLISQHGVMFTVATARTPATVVGLMDGIEARLPYILMAGGAVWDNARRAYTHVQTLADDTVGRLLSLFDAHGVRPFVYRQHGNQICVHHEAAMTNREHDFITPRLGTPYKRLVVDGRLSAADPDPAMLMFAIGAFDRMRALADDIDRHHIDCSYNCYHDVAEAGTGILDIYRTGTTKAAAIRQVAAECGADRIVVFGDNLNDIPMSTVADYSVAVANAFDEVKAAFDEVIGSNDEDAVAQWIMNDVKRTL